MWDICPVSGTGRWGFDLIVWINKKNMKRKFLWLLACFQHWGRLKGRKMMRITEFLRGFGQRFHENILSGPLVWGERSLSFDPWPQQGGMYCCEAFTCHWGKGGRGEHAGRLDKGTLEFSGRTHKFFLIPASYLWCDLSSLFFYKTNHHILVFWLQGSLGLFTLELPPKVLCNRDEICLQRRRFLCWRHNNKHSLGEQPAQLFPNCLTNLLLKE